eukprot:1878556-Prymnesium_polylepis.1
MQIELLELCGRDPSARGEKSAAQPSCISQSHADEGEHLQAGAQVEAAAQAPTHTSAACHPQVNRHCKGLEVELLDATQLLLAQLAIQLGDRLLVCAVSKLLCHDQLGRQTHAPVPWDGQRVGSAGEHLRS